MPGDENLTAIAPLADVDLRDDVKAERASGAIPTETVENALDGYVAGFAELCGGRGPVRVLDSVGGAYVMVSPTVTAPIADRFTGDDRAALIQEVTDRVNDHLKDVRDRVAERVPQHDDVLDPDMVNHKNRIYKAPLSLCADIDGVVTPVDAENPAYELTTPGDITDRLIDDTTAWAESFTDDYTDRVGELVATLWDGNPQEWETTLTEWLDAERTRTEPPESQESDGKTTPSTDSNARTAPISDVYHALNAQEVAEQTIVHAWNDDVHTSAGVRAFHPTWGPNSNGRANIVSETVWFDTGTGDKGTVVEMALIGADGVSWTRGKIANGKDWVRGIKELRALGFDVPLPAGDAPDDMSNYYAHDLSGVADENGVSDDPYDDDMALLKSCLYAREETPDLAGDKPPYGALRAVAEIVGLEMDDPEEGILGGTDVQGGETDICGHGTGRTVTPVATLEIRHRHDPRLSP